MNDRIKLELIVRYLAGECSDQEELEIESWMNKNPDNRVVIQKFQEIWDSKMNRSHFFDTEAAWSRLSEEIDREKIIHLEKQMEPASAHAGRKNERKRPSAFRQFVRVAAAIILVGFAAVYYAQFSSDDSQEVTLQQIVTEPGERTDVRLSDGSQIRLNVDSQLAYPREFETDTRIVHLTGEAYFDVSKDERPFYVRTDDAVIRVLGTEFNIQSYKEDQLVQIVVADGKVAVNTSEETDMKEVVLERGDMAQLNRNGTGELLINHGVNLHQYLGWLENRMQFDDTPLEQVVKKLERWYNVEFNIEDPVHHELRFTADFENESLHEILKAMQHTLLIDYKIDQRSITLFREVDTRENF